MSKRQQHLTAILTRITLAARELGIGPEPGFAWDIEPGSAVNGRTWNLHWRNEKTGGLYSPAGMNPCLGLTYAEAETELYRLADTLEGVIWTQQMRGGK